MYTDSVISVGRRILLSAALLALPAATGQQWPHIGGDSGGMKYSPLEQINRDNVQSLQVAWVLDTEDVSDGKKYPSRSALEGTAIAVNGTLYLSSAFARVFAVAPDTGEVKWIFDPEIDRNLRLNLFANRGVAYWTDGSKKRILLGDQQGRLFSLDADTGKPDPKFGEGGVLDLKSDMVAGAEGGRYGLTSPVAVCGDTIVAGGWVSDGLPRGPSGDIRGFDARSGALRWRFHTVPHPGEFGHDTWEGDSWKGRGGVNVWSMFSVDEDNGLVFAPLTSPAYDYFGGDRGGDNLFSDSVVALDCKTGSRRWHYQIIHHDLWDWDLPAQPLLTTLQRNGKDVPAVVQVTKQGYVYVFNRLTGEPLFDIEERPTPGAYSPEEKPSPTQPIPLKPRPFARQSMNADEITTVTEQSRRECLEISKGAVFGLPLFHEIGSRPTVVFPGTNGGTNWGGGAFDPVSGTLYVNSMDVGGLFRLVERPPDAALPYALRSAAKGRYWDSNEYPCQQPPWGRLAAIDLNSGQFRWESVLGEFDELTAQGVPKTGAPNIGGPLVTAGGLVFIAATNDGKFRAFDKKTGEEIWMTRLPASGIATPMTYRSAETGKQYVVIAAGGGNKYDDERTGKYVAFSLPEQD